VLRLNPVSKGYILDTHRKVSPATTLGWVKGVCGRAGITRVGEITALDRVGIPVFTSIRPGALEGAITVYTGKGCTQEEAEVSAIMEGIERFSAEPRGSDRRLAGSRGDLKGRYRILDPEALILPKARRYTESDPIEWVSGLSLSSGQEVFVPAEAVFHPYERPNQLFKTNTNGLAAGNALEEAVVHGLMEVIERDAWSLFEADPKGARDLDLDFDPDLLGLGLDPDLGLNINPGGDVGGGSGTGSLSGSLGPAGRLLERLRAAKVSVFAKDITSDVGIPTIAVALDDEITKDPALLSLGVGTHLIPQIALARALTEAVQSRLTTIHGTREDTYKAEFARRIGYERMKRLNRKWFEPSDEAVKIDRLRSFASNDFLKDVEYTVGRLADAGLGEVIVVDLSRQEVGVPAVRVIVPGLEVYALDKDRAGPRLRARAAKALERGSGDPGSRGQAG